MEILTKPIHKAKSTVTTFDKKSRDSYFEMLEVALRNLSLVDEKKGNQKVSAR